MHRIIAGAATDPVAGRIVWSPAKSIWIGTMSLGGAIGAPLFFSWDALALFVALCGITLSLGHSVGIHRKLVHGAFDCPRWLEYVLVYLGTLVGMAGPFGMIRIHDMRDWAQRQTACHDHTKHNAGLLRDLWWQLHCELRLDHPPLFQLERRLREDRFYIWLERTWRRHQLPLAALLFVLGGWSWVFWGICARVAVCVTGHSLVSHFAHKAGPQSWIVEGAAVQGYNLRIAGFISMGESWHNNHHAFPSSAKLGLYPGQTDPGWWIVRVLERVGLVWNVQTPESLPHRTNVRRAERPDDRGCPLRAGFRPLFGSTKRRLKLPSRLRFAV